MVRVYKSENYAEFQWLVGPIPVDDNIGREIITRFDTDIESNGIFFTDLNGREMLKRKRNYRDTWNLTLVEQVSGNYYPVTAKIAIEDSTRRFAILSDRAQGGSSLTDGSIEIMVSSCFQSKIVDSIMSMLINIKCFQVHRRLLHDDAFGVGEALNEIAFGKGLIARGSSYLVFGPKKHTKKVSTEANERFVQLQTLLPSWLFFSNVSQISYDVWKNNYKNIVSLISNDFLRNILGKISKIIVTSHVIFYLQFSGLSLSLPKNIHLLTFEPWKSDSILIRFEHILAKHEDEQYSQAVTFNFQDVFRSLDVASIRETTLSANQWLNQAKRLHFKANTDNLNETLASSLTASNQETNEPKNNIRPHISGRQYFETSNKRHFKRHRAAEYDQSDLKITLKPMEIRTFIVELE